jgi:competence protein ComEA
MRHPLTRFSVAVLFLLVAGGAAAEQAPASTPAQAKINVNTASAAELACLPRLGAKVAERIIEYRKSHGPFARPEELMEVRGIGEKLFLLLKPYVATSGPTTLRAKVRTGTARRSRSDSATSKPAAPSKPAVPVGKGR